MVEGGVDEKDGKDGQEEHALISDAILTKYDYMSWKTIYIFGSLIVSICLWRRIASSGTLEENLSDRKGETEGQENSIIIQGKQVEKWI